MEKISIVYWSGTGNTEKMAKDIKKHLEKNNNVDIFEVSDVSPSDLENVDKLALGCPSMGAEVLSDEMEDFVNKLNVDGKSLVLFGSYDWGDGQWMRYWETRMESAGANLKAEGLIVHLTPDEGDLDKCKSLADKLVK